MPRDHQNQTSTQAILTSLRVVLRGFIPSDCLWDADPATILQKNLAASLSETEAFGMECAMEYSKREPLRNPGKERKKKASSPGFPQARANRL